MYLPEGSFAPIPTPLTSADDFDPYALRAHLGWLDEEGLDGALILGTNGEFPSFTLDERKAVARAGAEARGGLKLLLNVGACAAGDALEMAREGAALGYDALLLPPPWYFRDAPVDGVAGFLRTVVEGSALPVLLYHIPQVNGVGITDELLDALGEHESLVGVKDSTGNEDEMARLLPRFKKGSYLVGHDRLVARCLEQGGRGNISACASVVPDLVASIRANPGQQGKLNSVRGLLEKFGLGAAVKAILRRKGFGDYATRAPMAGLPDSAAEGLYQMLDMFGAIRW